MAVSQKHDNETRARLKLPLAEDVIEDDNNSGGGGGNNNPPPPDDDEPVNPPKIELSDDDLLMELQKRNPKIQSLEDIREKEEEETPEQKKKKKNAAVLRHALKHELITTDEHADYIRDSAKDSRTIVYEEFYAKMKAKNKTDDQIDRAFKKIWNEEIEDSDPDFEDITATRNAEFETAAKRILRNRYPAMGTLEAKYDEHVTNITAERERNNNLHKTVNTYKSDLDTIFTAIGKKPIAVGDQQTNNVLNVDFEYPADVLQRIKATFLTKEGMLPFIANYDKSVLERAVSIALLEETHDAQIAFASKRLADSEVTKLKMGRKHILADDTGSNDTDIPNVDQEARGRVGL